jgi:hypothetical protein
VRTQVQRVNEIAVGSRPTGTFDGIWASVARLDNEDRTAADEGEIQTAGRPVDRTFSPDDFPEGSWPTSMTGVGVPPRLWSLVPTYQTLPSDISNAISAPSGLDETPLGWPSIAIPGHGL